MSVTGNVITKNRRLAILRFLSEERDYAMNTSTLQGALRMIGHSVTRDMVEADAAWLDEQGLARRSLVDGTTITVLTVTQRGVEVARGLAEHPGVDRPMPGI